MNFNSYKLVKFSNGNFGVRVLTLSNSIKDLRGAEFLNLRSIHSDYLNVNDDGFEDLCMASQQAAMIAVTMLDPPLAFTWEDC